MLPDLSSTKHTTRLLDLSNENVGGGGASVPLMGGEFWKSADALITSHVLLRLHILFCRFGASALWLFSVQNSTTWNINQLKPDIVIIYKGSPSFFSNAELVVTCILKRICLLTSRFVCRYFPVHFTRLEGHRGKKWKALTELRFCMNIMEAPAVCILSGINVHLGSYSRVFESRRHALVTQLPLSQLWTTLVPVILVEHLWQKNWITLVILAIGPRARACSVSPLQHLCFLSPILVFKIPMYFSTRSQISTLKSLCGNCYWSSSTTPSTLTRVDTGPCPPRFQ